MNKEDLIKIVNKNSTFDIDGSIKYVDVLDYGKLVNELLEAINYTAFNFTWPLILIQIIENLYKFLFLCA